MSNIVLNTKEGKQILEAASKNSELVTKLFQIPKIERLMYGPGAIVDERTGAVGGNINAMHQWRKSPEGKQAWEEYVDLIYNIASMVAAEGENTRDIAIWLSYNYQKILQELKVSVYGNSKKR